MNFWKFTGRFFVLNETISKFSQNQLRCYQTSQTLLSSKGGERTKIRNAELIRLYDQTGKVIGTKTKQEAVNIAKKNGFVLVPMEILGKPKFSEFQLKVRHGEAFGEIGESENSIEGEVELSETDIPEKYDRSGKEDTRKKKVVDIKRMVFETTIALGDLEVKLNQVNDWILREKQVHLTIVGTRGTSMDDIFTKISAKLVKEARIIQRKQKNNNLKLIMDKDLKSLSEITQSEDCPSERNPKDISDEFFIDPDLLSNDTELEKILNKNKKE